MKIFSSRKIMVIISLVLIIILGILVYLFVKPNDLNLPKKSKTKNYKYLFSIYGFGNKKSEMFNHPNGIAIAKNKNIYVTDQDNNRVLVFNNKGKFLFKFGKKGSKKDQFQSPMGIAISSKGLVYVTDRIQNKVLMFDLKGNFIKKFKVDTPLTPAIYKNRLYLTTGSKILMFDLNGNKLTEWGKRGSGDSQFNFPNGIAFGKNGTMFIADSGNVRIQALNLSGEDIWIAGNNVKKPDNKNNFGLPVSLAVDENNYIYVADAFPGSIRVLNDKGKQIKKFGEYGSKDGQFNLLAQIAYAGNRIFYVVDKYNNRVQAIQVPSVITK